MTAESEQILWQGRPVMFHNHPVAFILGLVLGIGTIRTFGIGALFLLVMLGWYLKCRATTLTVTTYRITLRQGLLSKNAREIGRQDVRNIQVRQRFLQRLLHVGTVAVSSAAAGKTEITVSGIRSPSQVADLVRQRQSAT